jgi:hypothetical protein
VAGRHGTPGRGRGRLLVLVLMLEPVHPSSGRSETRRLQEWRRRRGREWRAGTKGVSSVVHARLHGLAKRHLTERVGGESTAGGTAIRT